MELNPGSFDHQQQFLASELPFFRHERLILDVSHEGRHSQNTFNRKNKKWLAVESESFCWVPRTCFAVFYSQNISQLSDTIVQLEFVNFLTLFFFVFRYNLAFKELFIY